MKQWATAIVLVVAAGAIASCTGSQADDVRASDVELEQIAAEIQSEIGPAVVVSATTEDPGLVIVALQGLEPDPADVVEDACQVILDKAEGPRFSFLVLLDDGTPRWYGSTDNLDRCPPR